MHVVLWFPEWTWVSKLCKLPHMLMTALGRGIHSLGACHFRFLANSACTVTLSIFWPPVMYWVACIMNEAVLMVIDVTVPVADMCIVLSRSLAWSTERGCIYCIFQSGFLFKKSSMNCSYLSKDIDAIVSIFVAVDVVSWFETDNLMDGVQIQSPAYVLTYLPLLAPCKCHSLSCPCWWQCNVWNCQCHHESVPNNRRWH